MPVKRSPILRPQNNADIHFLRDLYAGVREEEMGRMAWPAEGKKAFIDMQFEAQSNHYLNHYANAAFMIIEMEGRSIGRLYVDRTATEIRIVDISLLPQYRRRGIGTMYLQTLLEEATGRGVPVTIHVETFNPAMQFYLRLGFRQKCTNGLYHFLQWTSKPEDPGC